MSLFRPHIAAMDGYTPGEQPGPRERVVKLNTNENPYPPSPRVLQALRETDWAVLRKYPSPMAEPARSAAARLWGVPPECVLCGNGSDELLTMIFRAFVGEGEVAAWPAPTYSLYPVLARIQNARVMEAPAGDDFALPLDDLAGLPARLLVVCNPNAPTGVYTPPEALADLAAAFRGVLVIDEAYADFSPGSAIAAVRGRPNVLVLRTLSKSYSLAGLRFGYAVGPRELIAGLVKVKDSYNCDGVSILAAAAALQDQAWMRAGVEKVVQQRVRLTRALRGLGFAVTPSSANFILAAVPGGDGRRCYEALKGRGILVRWWNLPRLADKVRITVGTPEENDCLLDALDILSKEAAP